MKMLSEGKSKAKSMGNVLHRTVFPTNSTARKIVRLRPLFPQIKKSPRSPEWAFLQARARSYFSKRYAEKSPPFPPCLPKFGRGENVANPTRPKTRTPTVGLRFQLYLPNRHPTDPSKSDSISFEQRTWRLASKPPAKPSHPKTRRTDKKE